MNNFNLSITTNQYAKDREEFIIEGLPALGPGERYVLTYDARPDQGEGIRKVSNTATASGNGIRASATFTHRISGILMEKSGYESNGYIFWTIGINTDGHGDVSGFQLTDTITIDGEEYELPEDTTVWLTEDNLGREQIQLPYTFPEGSTKTYRVTYSIPVPPGEPGEKVSITTRAAWSCPRPAAWAPPSSTSSAACWWWARPCCSSPRSA